MVFSVKAKQMGGRTPNIGRGGEQRGIDCILDDEVDYEEIMKNARKMKILRISTLFCKVTIQPERNKLGATMCK